MDSIISHIAPADRPLVLAASPRVGGNSDCMADAVVRGLEAAGATARLIHLRDLDLMPCRGCQACSKSASYRCVLMERDRTEELFAAIVSSPKLFFCSPIYFYHLPGLFKGFIDRAQRYYEARMGGDPGLLALAPRRAHACLVAGRPRGDKLFEGSLLTLRYFLWPFNALLGEPLCLPGVDGIDDLRRDELAQARVTEFALKAWRNGSTR